MFAEHGQLDIAFLPRAHQSAGFPVSKIFIPLRVHWRDLKPGTLTTRTQDIELRMEEKETGPIEWNHLLKEFFQSKNQTLLILGKPGSGKTTCLRRIAYDYAAKLQGHWRDRLRIPFYLKIKQLVETVEQDPNTDLRTLIATSLATAAFKQDLTPWLDQLFTHHPNPAINPTTNPPLILLDAVDEVADTEQRSRIMAWIKQQLAAYPQCKFMITSRIHGFRTDYAPDPGNYIPVVVDDFDKPQRRDFLIQWYNHLHSSRSNPLASPPTWQPDSVASQMADQIDDNDQLTDLATNPLMLTMLAVIGTDNLDHGNHDQPLPSSRLAVYKACFSLFINEVRDHEWEAIKALNTRPESAQEVLRAAAWAIQTQQPADTHVDADNKDKEPTGRVPIDTLVRHTQANLAVVSNASVQLDQSLTEQEIYEVFRFSHERTPLLVEPEIGHWQFLHKSFQEYLAAETLVLLLSQQQTDLIREWLQNHWGRSYWNLVWALLQEAIATAQNQGSASAKALIRGCQHSLLPLIRHRFEDHPEALIQSDGRYCLEQLIDHFHWPQPECQGLQKLAWRHMTQKLSQSYNQPHRLWHCCHRVLTPNAWCNSPTAWLTPEILLNALVSAKDDLTLTARLLLLGGEVFVQDKPQVLIDHYQALLIDQQQPEVINSIAALVLDYWQLVDPTELEHLLMVSLPAVEFYRGVKPVEPLSLVGNQDTGGPYALPAYQLARFQVTNYQYARYLAQVTDPEVTADLARYQTRPFDPAVLISHSDAQAYCQWLSQTRSGDYQLPTEAQWERAARGPALLNGNSNRRLWPWGYWQTGYCNNVDADIDTITLVGAFPLGRSPEQVQDMVGNVWEWCADKYSKDYYQQSTIVQNKQGDYFVKRGGAYQDVQHYVSCVYRSNSFADRSYDIGFRVARIN